MFHNKNCNGCYWVEEYEDMGASWDVCTLHKDLYKASRAVECNQGNCPCRRERNKTRNTLYNSVKDKIKLINLQHPKKDCQNCKHFQNVFIGYCNKHLLEPTSDECADFDKI